MIIKCLINEEGYINCYFNCGIFHTLSKFTIQKLTVKTLLALLQKVPKYQKERDLQKNGGHRYIRYIIYITPVC